MTGCTVGRSGPLIGSLCSGYGGLDLGVQAVLGGAFAWHAEIDPGPARILSRHWPTVPNLGDITAVNWAGIPEVCVLTAGFPCQRCLGRRPSCRAG
ncbi:MULTISPECIES: DNA cytosine methyltransferase [unclassified Streptomyces]|uniref:DNA cytosine methyltransferase n=1 Tax=unclassified Streptomyces TaxID=2593676 RepID=UPI002E18FB18|nr:MULTISPECIES: DNA cytosine methyltransferase [unclassified Streptomyces]